jgi:hypothetical protein
MSSNRSTSRILQALAGRRAANTVDTVAARFLQVFQEHGVEAAQIPRLLPEIRISDLQTPATLLAALAPEILDKTAQLFGVRSHWLEGVDDEIYDYLAVNKQPETLLERLAAICANQQQTLCFPLRVLTTRKALDWHNDDAQYLALVLVEQIAMLGEENICRYHVYRDGFDWSHLPARLELKAIVRVVFDALHTPVPLFVVSRKEMDDILDGKLIPRRFLNGCQITNPSLEDYALSEVHSHVARETEELPAVLAYIERHHLRAYSFAQEETTTPPETPADSPTASTPPETSKPPKPSGKRQAQADNWESIRIAARTLWAEDSQRSITDMIRRLQKVPALKAAALSESAIRKHIADLAPPGIRGKSGRKPKQSP